MASRSSVHEWINSAGVIITFCVAGFSAWLSWTSIQLKNEDLLTFSEPSSDCRVEYSHFEADRAIIGTCWIVTVANKSEGRLSIVNSHMSSIVSVKEHYTDWGIWEPWFTTVQEPSGKSTEFPITLEGGAARRFLIRTPIIVPAAIKKIIDDLPQFAAKTLESMSMRDLEREIAGEHHLSLLGDPVEVVRYGDKITSWRLPLQHKTTQAAWEIVTGRGRNFYVYFTWPPTGGNLYTAE